MLKIRFQRTGRKNDPAFRMVVIEHTASPRAGKNVATVGSYHPKTKQTLIDADAVKKWMAHGAKASGTVHNLLVTQGIIEGKKVNVLSRKKPIVKEEKEEKKEEKAEEKPTEPAAEADADSPKEEAKPEADVQAEEAQTDETPKEEEKVEEKTSEEPAPEEKKEETAS